VATALSIYEASRRPRASAMQARSFDNATLYHHRDGEEQRRRDTTFAALAETSGDGVDPMEPIYGYNPFTTDLAPPT